MKVIITGDSHTNSLRRAAPSIADEIAGSADQFRIAMFGNGRYTLKKFSETTPDGVTLSVPEYREALTALNGSAIFAGGGDTVYGINLGLHSLPVVRSRMWEKFAPWRIAEQFKLLPLSDAVLDEIVYANNVHIYAFFEALVASKVRFFIISAPPVRRDHRCFRKTEPVVGLAVDNWFRSTSLRHFERYDIPVVLPPQECLEPNGFLRDDLAEKTPGDHHHGNEKFGKIMLRKILECLPDLVGRSEASVLPDT